MELSILHWFGDRDCFYRPVDCALSVPAASLRPRQLPSRPDGLDDSVVSRDHSGGLGAGSWGSRAWLSLSIRRRTAHHQRRHHVWRSGYDDGGFGKNVSAPHPCLILRNTEQTTKAAGERSLCSCNEKLILNGVRGGQRIRFGNRGRGLTLRRVHCLCRRRGQRARMVRSQPQLDQGTGIGRQLRLPPVVSLKFLHGCLRFCVPLPGRLAAEVVLLNQCGLDFFGAVWINPALSLDFSGFFLGVARSRRAMAESSKCGGGNQRGG